MKVFVYFNLHKKCFSVKALEGMMKGRVIAHRDSLHLQDVTFKVSEKGRQRVIRERRKNVHAGVVGNWNDLCYTEHLEGKELTYDPYKYDSFVEKDTLDPRWYAEYAYLNNKRIFV